MAATLTANDDVMRRLLPRLPAGVWSLSGFTVVWFGGIVIPLLAIILVSFLQGRGIRINFDPSFLQYERFFSYGGSDLLARSVRIAATITFIELMIAFPFALWLAKGCKNNMVRLLTFTALTVPFFLSPAARVIVWRSVFGINGVVNQALLGIGAVDEPVTWLIFSEFAVHFGFLGAFFPTMVWPIFLSISLIDNDFLEASNDLGANRFRTLVHVIFPLALPGVVAGIVFTFIPMLGDTVVAQHMGGNNVLMLSAQVQSLIGVSNFLVAAALAAVVLGIMLAFQVLLWAALKPVGGLNEVFANLRR
ncbi:MAG: ABC transporter permease [Rhodospirillales bacterium]|nr:ABC transporter permease [Rhodospirillales bacterium]